MDSETVEAFHRFYDEFCKMVIIMNQEIEELKAKVAKLESKQV